MAQRLAEACSHPTHQFWPETISLLRDGLIQWRRILGPRQITDAYLLAMAVAHGQHGEPGDHRGLNDSHGYIWQISRTQE